MRLLTRMVIVAAILVIATAALIAMATYFQVENSSVRAELRQLSRTAGLLGVQIETKLNSSRNDTLAMANLPSVRRLATALATGDPTEIDAARPAAEAALVALLRNKPDYVQLRVISANKTGDEIVRVDRDRTSRSVAAVPRAELQSKADRPYVDNTLRVPPGTVYFSPIELNQEFGEIERPYLPVMRLGTPLAVDGEIVGLFIINYDMRPLFDTIREPTNSAERHYLVNTSGDFLVHPNRSLEFGFDLGARHGLDETFPDMSYRSLIGSAGEAFDQPTVSGENVGIAWRPVVIGSTRIKLVLVAMDSDVIRAAARAALVPVVLAMLPALALALILAVILARIYTRPISRFARAIVDFDKGKPAKLPLDTPAELVEIYDRIRGDFNNRRLYVSLVRGSAEAIVSTDTAGRITTWNQAATRMYGIRADEALGLTLDEIRDGAFAEGLPAFEDEPAFFDSVFTTRPGAMGKPIDVAVTRSPIRADDGELVGISEFSLDVTEQRRGAERFRLVFDASPSAFISVDRAGIIRMVNDAAVQMFGFDKDEMIGSEVDKLTPRPIRSSHADLRESYYRDSSVRPMGEGKNLTAIRRDGTAIPVEINLNPYESDDGPLVLATIVDITMRQRLEAERIRFTEELQRSNEDLQRFAYVASHDLQEPLRMVTSFCQLIGDRYSDKLDDEGKEFIDFAVDGATRMKRMINDLLQYSRLQTHQIAPVAFPAKRTVDAAMTNLSAAIEEANAQIEIGELPDITADEGQIAHVFQNLIGNALKFRGTEPPHIGITCECNELDHVFSVKDNGIGVDVSAGTDIFEVFSRLHSRDQYPGTGIGLAICKRVIERHGGRIWIENPPEGGAWFKFTLPVVPHQAEEA